MRVHYNPKSVAVKSDSLEITHQLLQKAIDALPKNKEPNMGERSRCDHFALDYKKKQSTISNACIRKTKMFLGKYFLRHPIDDEFANKK